MDANSGLVGLPYTVVRIRAGDPTDANIVHFGTGFFFGLKSEEIDIPLIVSNKHVLCNKTWIEFDFGLSDSSNIRIMGPPQKVTVPHRSLPIFEHPDPNVDLAAMPLNPILQIMGNSGFKPHALLLSAKNLIPDNLQTSLHAATSILMVGFPNGIMDEVNNLPVVRRGSLATPYRADYQGQTNFAVDIASFGGSSGSPVFAFFEHILTDEKGTINFLSEPQIHLIGVLHSGPMMTAKGIVPVPVPTNFLVSQTNVMIHIGYCVKARRIEELLVPIKPLLDAEKRRSTA